MENELENLQNRLTSAVARANEQLSVFVTDFADGATHLMAGDLVRYEACEASIGLALDCQGGIICAPLHYMKYVDSRPTDVLLLKSICATITKLATHVIEWCRRLGISRKELHRFAIRHDEIFSPGYFTLHGPHSACRDRDAWRAEYRHRAINAVCATARSFFVWLRSLLMKMCAYAREMVVGVVRTEEVNVAASMRQVVAMCDPKLELLVLRSPEGLGSLRFAIPSRREKVWAIVRRLVEDADVRGEVALPKNYGSHFHSTTADNDTVADDIDRLYRHIHPSPHHTGRYRLCYAEKPRLQR